MSTRYKDYGYHTPAKRKNEAAREAALLALQGGFRAGTPERCPRDSGHGLVVRQRDDSLWCPACGEVPGYGPAQRPLVMRRYYPDLPESIQAGLDFSARAGGDAASVVTGPDSGEGGGSRRARRVHRRHWD